MNRAFAAYYLPMTPLRARFIAWLQAALGVRVYPGATTLWLLKRDDGGFEDYAGRIFGAADLPALRVQTGGNLTLLDLRAEDWRAHLTTH